MTKEDVRKINLRVAAEAAAKHFGPGSGPKQRPCHHCNGTGLEIDQTALGLSMRAKREKAGISLRKLAIALDVSAPYLSDLELGKRGWNTERIEQFNKLIRTPRHARKVGEGKG